MKEFKNFARRAATIFLAIAIICTSSAFDQLTAVAAETVELQALTTEPPAAEAPAAPEVGPAPAELQAAAVAPVVEAPAATPVINADPTVVEPVAPESGTPDAEANDATPEGEAPEEKAPVDGTVEEEVVVEPVEEEGVTTTFKVSFVGFEGADLGTVEVEDGQAATSPEAPVVEGYTFTGWDADFAAVTSDMTVKATYTLNEEVKTFVVTFLGMDDTVLGTADVVEGATVAADVVPVAPEVEGFTFTGWDKDFTVVTEDMTVKAVYEETILHIVTFLGMNDEVLGTAEVKTGETVAEESIPTSEMVAVKGYTFTGWDKDFSVVAEDMSVKATYEIFPEFNASVNVGDVVISAHAEAGIIEPDASLTAEIVELTAAQEEKVDETSTLEDTSVKHAFDINIIAKNGEPLQPVFGEDVQITFSNTVALEGVEAGAEAEVVYVADDASEATIEAATKASSNDIEFDAKHFSIYVYVGQIDKKEEYKFSGTHAYYYHPDYSPGWPISKQKYFVNVGEITGTILFPNENDKITPNSVNIKLQELEGYRYTGNAYYNKDVFDVGDESYNDTKKINHFKIKKNFLGNKKVYAVSGNDEYKIDKNDIIWEYKKLVTVSYDTKNKGETITSDVEFAGTDIILPTLKQTPDKKSFGGWYNGKTLVGNAGDSFTVPTANVTLKAQWDNLHQLVFQTNGGTLSGITVDEESSIWVKKGSVIELPQISKTGHTFTGWYKDASMIPAHKVTSSYKVLNPGTLFAGWSIDQFNVKFTFRNASHTEEDKNQMVNYNGSATPPPISLSRVESPTEYYKFLGWDDLDTKDTFDKLTSAQVAAEKITKAKNYKAIYEVQPKEVKFFVAKIGEKPEVSKDSKDFDSELSYKAKIKSFYEENEIPVNYFSIITYDGDALTDAIAERSEYNGYTIIWDRMVKRSDGYHIDGHKEAITYEISYDLKGGSVTQENPTSYKVTDSFTLNKPTRTGYTFAGWTGSNGDEPQTTVEVAGSTGDKTYTANWEIKTYKVIFEYKDSANAGKLDEQTIDYNFKATAPSVDSVIITPDKFFIFKGWDDTTTDKVENLKKADIDKRLVLADKKYVAQFGSQLSKIMFFVAKEVGSPENSNKIIKFDKALDTKGTVTEYIKEKTLTSDFLGKAVYNQEKLDQELNSKYSGYEIKWYRLVREGDGYHIDGYKVKKAESFLKISDIEPKTYNGTEWEPELEVKDGDNTLVKGTDYTVEYTDNLNAGTAKAIVTGMGNYEGSVTKEFEITPAPLSVTAVPNSKFFDEEDPVLQFIVGDTQNTEEEAAAFTGILKRADGVTPGDYSITQGTLALKDNGAFKAANYAINFTPSIFTINKKSIAGEGIRISGIVDKTYDGSFQYQNDLQIMDGETPLAFDTDYELVYAENLYAGTATLTVKGTNNYKDSQTFTFIIAQVELNITVANASKTVGTADPAFTATVTGELPEGQELIYTLSRVPGESVGTYAITPNLQVRQSLIPMVFAARQLVNVEGFDEIQARPIETNEYEDTTTNYKFNIVPGTLTINAAPITDPGQEPTPATPTPTPTTTITPGITATAATLPPSNIVIDEAPVALARAPRVATPVAATVEEEEEVVEAADEVTQIEDEDTALADDVTEIAEEETPLAVPVENCMIHWLILLLTAAYTIYEVVRGVARRKKINELTDSEAMNKSDANA